MANSQEITQKIIELNNEIQIISEDEFVLSIENEKLLNNLLNIKKMLKKLKQDLIINDIEDSETIACTYNQTYYTNTSTVLNLLIRHLQFRLTEWHLPGIFKKM